jgi:hypothetical protein
MTIIVVCPNCRQQHNAPDNLAGMACRCPCGGVLQVPLTVICPSCGQQHAAPEELAGLDCECPCGAILQIPERQAAMPVAKMRSIFDELTESDLTHQAAVQAPVAVMSDFDSASRVHPAYAKAMEEEFDDGYDRGHVPVQINLAGFCLATGGGFELVAAGLAFMVLVKEGAAQGPALFMGIVGMVWGMLGMMNIVVAVAVLTRSPYGQLFGLMMAVLNICSLSPRLVVAAIFIIFSLASKEASAWFKRKRR